MWNGCPPPACQLSYAYFMQAIPTRIGLSPTSCVARTQNIQSNKRQSKCSSMAEPQSVFRIRESHACGNRKMRKWQMPNALVHCCSRSWAVRKNAVNLIAGREAIRIVEHSRDVGGGGVVGWWCSVGGFWCLYWWGGWSGQRTNQCNQVKVPNFALFTVIKRRPLI